MSRSSTPTRRLAAVATAAALFATGLLTGTANAETGSVESVTGSSGGSVDVSNLDLVGSAERVIENGNDPDLQRSDTATVDNVTITREVVGQNVGAGRRQVTFRTTFSAAGTPDRLITRIDDQGPNYTGSPSAKITYTKADGGRTTETLTSTPDGAANYVAPGPGWPIGGAGATVVLEVTYTWYGTMRQEYTAYVQNSGIIVDISGLGTQNFPSMKAQTRCDGCAGYTMSNDEFLKIFLGSFGS
ncbi:hypothetical protein BTZ20_1874 [Rhodococcus sp. MTM3W5.2]|uniref:hypothetical protein n=1 Tax=Rhodococcus sp. MTM3W5.2 TaxID=1805827 RepID=UPI0009792C0F|nr:hypothetical protein [Rhodococcus sp. MTM3W5.2]AQA21154.1 hypothetical protein BTZ20_1874 [Rhodococcus sp. MTM3W5.2]